MQNETQPLRITEEIALLVNGCLDSGTPMVLAAVSEDRRPVVSFRGSTAVFSDTQLSFWVRNRSGNTLAAIGANPWVALMYRSSAVPMLEFHGQARVVSEGEERDRAYHLAHEREQRGDPDKRGVAVIIDLERISGVLGFENGAPIWCKMAV